MATPTATQGSIWPASGFLPETKHMQLKFLDYESCAQRFYSNNDAMVYNTGHSLLHHLEAAACNSSVHSSDGK